MPKPFTHIRVSNFFGENDDTPVSIEDGQASTLQDFVKDRKKLKRRKGTDALGSASLSPDQNLNGLEWCRIDGTEHLIGVHSLDVVDFFHSTPGTIAGNGTDKLATATDANMAFVNNRLYLGNGTDQNLRYNGTSAGLAADFAPNATDALKVNRGSNALFEGQDLTVAVWVRFDDLAFNATALSPGGRLTVCAIDDRGSSARKSWRLVVNPNTNRLNFAVHDAAGAETTVADTTALVTGTWYFVVAQHNAATDLIKIQVNGGTITTAACAHGLDQPASGYFSVGYTPNLDGATGNDAMDGRVGPLGVWRSAEGAGGALSTALMTALYNNGLPLEEADLAAAYDDELVAFWEMGESSGTRDDDHNSGSTFDLIAFGAGVGSAEGPHAAYAVAVAMVPKPTTAPTVDLDVGATHESDNETEFVYRISFLNADGVYGEAGDEAEDAAYTFNLDFTSNLTNIPLCPAGNDCTGRRIWRRSGGSLVFRHVADILDNTTTTYLDAVLNADLGEDLVDFNTRFPPCKYLVPHQRRMVGAGNVTDPDLMFVSNVDEPYYCPESPDLEDPNQGTRARVDGPAGGEIVGLCSHGGLVAVFTGGQGHLLLGVEPNDFRLQKFCDVGCAAHRTICSAKSLLIWLGHDGVYAWDGTSVKRISDDQRVTLEALTAAEMAGAHAYVLDDRYHLCWATGSIYFDLEHGVWGTYSNWTWRDAATAPFVSSARPRVWGAREGAARVYQLETGATDDGTNISATWESRDWDMGLAGREKRVHWVELKFKKAADPATCLWTLKRGTGETIQQGAVEIGAVDVNGGTVSRHQIPVNELGRDEHFRLRLQVASPTSEVVLLSAGLHYTLAS
jgi:hypothetical protein